jgi:hypothetical protein
MKNVTKTIHSQKDIKPVILVKEQFVISEGKGG